jgi:hypothetical protein
MTDKMRIRSAAVAVGASSALLAGAAHAVGPQWATYAANPTFACFRNQPGYRSEMGPTKRIVATYPALGVYSDLIYLKGVNLAGFAAEIDLITEPVDASKVTLDPKTLPGHASVAFFRSEAIAKRYFALNWPAYRYAPHAHLLMQRYRNVVVVWKEDARPFELALLTRCLRTGNPAPPHRKPESKQAINKADQRLAEQRLLRLSQFEHSWSSRPWFTGPCPWNRRSGLEDLTETGFAYSDVIWFPPSDTTITTETRIFKSSTQAKTAFTVLLDNRYCNTADFVYGAKAKFKSYGDLPFPRYGDQSAAVRLVFATTPIFNTSDVQKSYKDTLIVRRGRAVTKIIVSSYVKPLTRRFEQSLLGRLGFH